MLHWVPHFFPHFRRLDIGESRDLSANHFGKDLEFHPSLEYINPFNFYILVHFLESLYFSQSAQFIATNYESVHAVQILSEAFCITLSQ